LPFSTEGSTLNVILVEHVAFTVPSAALGELLQRPRKIPESWYHVDDTLDPVGRIVEAHELPRVEAELTDKEPLIVFGVEKYAPEPVVGAVNQVLDSGFRHGGDSKSSRRRSVRRISSSR
jgi:hypothetical protein